MELYITILTLTAVLSTSAEFEHAGLMYAGCSDVEEQFYIGYDEEELGHVDFKQKKTVQTIPDFAGKNITLPRFYEIGADAIVGCKRDLPTFVEIFKSLPLETGPYVANGLGPNVASSWHCWPPVGNGMYPFSQSWAMQ
ncbi:hypothetical protein QQF64_031760 [Cirrhinus molitorella]|uniref:MHC class II alpha chain N-terminal domain-containing protein n=1 Tax=Cirrhinus molitorella TaxID=172907 RepID=A0ABR3MXV7_9TELE